jgi:serine/threonine protein kinase
MQDITGHSIGRYQILEPLGQGGMASVYKAFDTRLEAEVAVKVIRTDMFPPAVLERMLKRFEREAKAVARLNHPNIVGVIDYGEYEGFPYLVMKYMPGGTLKVHMGQPMPYNQAARLLAPIARALAYAHGQGVLHRDVKPANILITQSGEPVLTDFGIAKLVENEKGQTLTGTGMGIGTPEYMAPEQGLAQDVDGRADVYALGVVFYELVTGRRPFMADTPMAVLLKQVNDPLPRPKDFVSSLPKDAEQVILKSLAKNPADRYEDMFAFSLALEKLARNTTTFPSMQSSRKKEKLDPTANEFAAETYDELETNSSFSQIGGKNQPKKKSLVRWKWGLGGLAILCLLAMIVVFILLPKFEGNKEEIEKLAVSTTAMAQTETVSIEQPTQVQSPEPTKTASPTPWMTIPNKDDQLETSNSTTDQSSILFEEDFEDGKTQQITYISGNWQIIEDESGNNVFEMDNSNSSGYPGFILGAPEWSNYKIQFRMKIIGAGNGQTIIHFRRRNDNAYYAISIDARNVNFNYTQDDDPWHLITSRENSLSKETWHWIRIEANGMEFQVFIDDTSLIYTDDTRFDSGNVHFFCGPNSHVQLDDIQVISLDE